MPVFLEGCRLQVVSGLLSQCEKSMQQHSLGNQATRIYRYVSFTCGPDFIARCATIKAKGIISETLQKIEKLFSISTFDFHSVMWSFMILDTVFIYLYFIILCVVVRSLLFIHFLAWCGMMDAVTAQ